MIFLWGYNPLKKSAGAVQDGVLQIRWILTESIENLEVNPMVPEYLRSLFCAIDRITILRIKEPSVRYVLLCLMCRFLSCRSIWEIALHYGIPKDRLYRSVNKLKSLTQLMAIRRSGLQELAQHLRKLSKASLATISRQRVLLCVDDATEKTRGVLGSLASLIWRPKPNNSVISR
ncbi:MAG: hypothetical protein WA705_09265, partial [Candidatus Ozemobacteraceae bacterium]